MESRLFFKDPLYPGQRRHDLSLTVEPTLYLEQIDGGSITFTPHLRVDDSKDGNLSADIREAYYLTYGYFGDTEWELRLGIDQVFWGTAESNNLVNIVNQTDLAADPSGDAKLGQPMAHGTLAGDWGTLDLLVLPFHRPRTFPGAEDRLRPALPVESRRHTIKYEHRSGDRHIDLAARYGHSIGPLDFGISGFKGTSREPLLGISGFALTQQYNQIEQVGLDLQLTLDDFIGKAEFINRTGFAGSGTGKSTYNAFVVGGEHSIYGVFDSDADLTLMAEWSMDSRRAQATTPLQNDLFLGARYALNDVDDTDFTAAIIEDLDYATRGLNLIFTRRLTDSLSLEMEAQTFLATDQKDLQMWQVRNDDFIAVNLTVGF